MRATALLLPALWLAASSPAQQSGIARLVYGLADPRGLYATEERLVALGPQAVPVLLKALADRDFRFGNHAWTDVNRIPELADKSGADIVDAALGHVLHVLRLMGPRAKSALPQLIEMRQKGPRRIYHLQGQSHLQAVTDTAVAIAMLTEERKRLLETRGFAHRVILTCEPDVADAVLVRFLLSGSADAMHDAAIALARRTTALRRDAKRRRRVVRELLRAARDHAPDPNLWPMSDSRFRRRSGQAMARTLQHDYASLALARLEPRELLAMRGHMLLLRDPRQKVRHESALQLGAHGAASAPATYCLIEATNDPAAVVQRAAIVALGRIGETAKPAIPCLRTLALGEDKALASIAKASLHRIDPAPSPVWTYYHHNGQVKAQGRCDGVVKVGVWRYWKFDGTKYCEGEYRAGRQHGAWTYWLADGPRTFRYVAGELVR